MPRETRIQEPWTFYHVMSRGNNKQRIFVSDGDRACFLGILGETVARHSWECHAFCLMDNHYHLLVRTPKPNLSDGMHFLNSSYSKIFKQKYDTVGHLFQGRFLSPVVKDDQYLLELSRYVVLNPVRKELARRPEDWKWSSYRATIGLGPKPPFLEIDFLLSLFSKDREKAKKKYRIFVADSESTDELDGNGRIPIQKINRDIRSRDDRNRFIKDTVTVLGYTRAEVASFLGISQATISRVLQIEV